MRAKGALKHDLAEYAERLDREIKMIQNMKFSGYFLMVWDFIRYAKDHGHSGGTGPRIGGRQPGRATRWQITDIDPLQYGLLFERFLNPERVSMPDIDVDFCMNRRGEVIQYVTAEVRPRAGGADHHVQYAGRARGDQGRGPRAGNAVRRRGARHQDGARTSSTSRWRRRSKQEPGFDEAAKKDPRVDDVLKVALRLEGLARNCSVHAAGVVISPQPLKDLVPLYKTNRDEIVTQFDMGGLEKLAAAQDGFPGADDADADPGRAAADREAARRGDRAGGSAAGRSRHLRSLLQGLHQRRVPVRIAAACATSCAAISRAAWKISRRSTRSIVRARFRAAWWTTSSSASGAGKAVQYDLPELKELLEETYGVIVYQEQVMQISNRIAGYSLGDADLLRRAMGKKKLEEMAKQRERFVKGALERGFPQKKVEKIFDLMEQFAGYGFNKSHSAAYAYLAFVTAYLKAHYPIDFMAALLTSETGNTAKVVKYINECREMGITVLPPDVNHSEWSFTPDGEAIRFGLGAVKNLGQSAVEAIGKAREEVGTLHVAARVLREGGSGRVNRRMIESLIKAGAMDSLEGTRSQKFAAVEGAMEAGQRAQRDRESGQVGLFGEMLDADERTIRAAAQCPGLDGQGEARRREGTARLLGDGPSAGPLHGQGRGAGDARQLAIWRAWRRTPRWRSAAC